MNEIICKKCYSEKHFKVIVRSNATSAICQNCLDYYAIVDHITGDVDHYLFSDEAINFQFNKL